MSSNREKMLKIIDEVDAEFAERRSLIELIAIALLTRKNLFILGLPGQAKSDVINFFRKHITGTKQFATLVTKQTDEEQIFGRLDLASIIPGGVSQSILAKDQVYNQLLQELTNLENNDGFHSKLGEMQEMADKIQIRIKILAAIHGNKSTMITQSKIPEADIVFLDEIFKANDGILNSLLTALNERTYTNEGVSIRIPAVSFLAASNEIPNFNDPNEQSLRALYDRFEIRVFTQNVESRRNRQLILEQKQSNRSQRQVITTITLNDLAAMQEEVKQIYVPPYINGLVDDIVCYLRENKIEVSDRRLFSYYPMAQAQAWLNGDTEVNKTHLDKLLYYFWQKTSDIPIIQTAIQQHCNDPYEKDIAEIEAKTIAAYEKFTQDYPVRRSALNTFRHEFVDIYKKCLAFKEIEGISEMDIVKFDTLINQTLEALNKQAHERAGFTYTRLEEIKQLLDVA